MLYKNYFLKIIIQSVQKFTFIIIHKNLYQKNQSKNIKLKRII